MFALFCRGAVWKYVIPLLVVLLVCGGGLTWLGSLIIYTGPMIPKRDYVVAHRETGLGAVGRDGTTNDADWESVMALTSTADTIFADLPGGFRARDVFAVDEEVFGEPPPGTLTGEQYVLKFQEAGGDALLDAVRDVVDRRAPPIRVLADQSRITIESVDLGDITSARNIARMLAFRGRAQQADLDWDQFVDTLESLHALAQVYQAQNTLIERLVGNAIEGVLHQEIQHAAADPELVGLEQLETLSSFNDEPPRSAASVLDGERLWVLGTFKETLGNARIYPLSYSAQASVVNEYFDILVRLAEGDETAAAEQAALMARITQNWRYAPSNTMLPAVGRFLGAEESSKLLREQTALVLAIERHRRVNGALPESLADIADRPTHDAGFVYVTTDDEPGYIVGHPEIHDSMPPVGDEPGDG